MRNLLTRAAPPLILGGEARVQLMPPEVAVREKERGMRRLSIVVLALVLVLVSGGYVVALAGNASQQAALVTAQARTSQLAADALKYSKVTAVNEQISNVGEAKTLTASTEVLWAGVIAEVQGVLPGGASIESASMKGRAPWEAVLQPAGPLRAPRVATVTIIIGSRTILDATALVSSLVNITGFADASPDSVTHDGAAYHTAVTLDINEKALSGRFATKEASK